jgi:drug/metabolite transporter (DMT)-like permease
MAVVLVGADLKSGTNLLLVGLAVLSALSFSLYTVLSKKLMTKLSGII